MSEQSPIEQARPALEEWAKDAGVRIQWFHEWTDRGSHVVTAFGFDSANAHRHNSVLWPLGEMLHVLPDPHVDRMAGRLAKECVRLFGTPWTQESARCFARVALNEARRMSGA
jgi:hypothetical protein